MRRGAWNLSMIMFDDGEISDGSLEHIAEMIKQGFTSGELLEEGDETDDKEN